MSNLPAGHFYELVFCTSLFCSLHLGSLGARKYSIDKINSICILRFLQLPLPPAFLHCFVTSIPLGGLRQPFGGSAVARCPAHPGLHRDYTPHKPQSTTRSPHSTQPSSNPPPFASKDAHLCFHHELPAPSYLTLPNILKGLFG